MPGTLNPIRTLIVNSLPEPEAEDSAASILHCQPPVSNPPRSFVYIH